MPELPEVETVRRGLEQFLLGRTVLTVEAKPVALRRPLIPEVLRSGLEGKVFSRAMRRGKYLLLEIGDGSLLVHLGMSGRLQLAPAGSARPQHTHFVARLDNGLELRFVDPRRFGFADYLGFGQEAHDPSLARLGLEPLSRELSSVLPQLYRSSKAPVKSLLLDQGRVAGIGNIYAAEALWRCGVYPARPGSRTSVARLRRLAQAIHAVLQEAIEQGGTTLRDFAAPDGSQGYFAVRLAVYGKEGQPCPRCDRLLRRIVIAGRSTIYCPGCQR